MIPSSVMCVDFYEYPPIQIMYLIRICQLELGKFCKNPSNVLLQFSVEEIAYYAMDMFSDELCWMMEMNWLDMEYNFNETKYAEDVMELPATVSAALLDEEAFNQCQQEALAMMASEYDNGCSDEYTEEELENLEEIGELASGIMCLKKTFDESCADYIENELIYMIQAASSMNLAGK